jgi:hypothetical protein
MHSTAEFEQERREFQALLASGIFDRAPNLAQVLTYICERYFEGMAEQIKEYNIAVEALGRPARFDQRRDSIVRVEAHRLRKRLREYYDADGAGHSVRIEIPPGQYAPLFIRRHSAPHDASEDAGIAPVPETPAAEWVEEETIAQLDHTVSFTPPRPLLLAPPAAATRNSALWVAITIAVLTLCGLFIWRAYAVKVDKVSAAPIGVVGAAPSPSFGILPGLQHDYTDRFGRVWLSDRYYQGGSTFEFTGRPIAATRDQRLFTGRREGTFSYDIPLAPGTYELRLYFAENLYGEYNMAGGGETTRVFSVYANSAQILSDFDVIREVGASTADVRAFKDISPAADGKLHLRFAPGNNPAMVSAIEITPSTPGKILPIRMVSRDHPYTDKEGRVWAADSYSRGGLLVTRTKPVENIYDPELLNVERFGNLNYVIPVPPGHYAATLYFVETWFGPGEFAGGGVGSRLFDILCNGVALRRSFDIFKEAHGRNRAVIFPIHGLEPDPQGKITISLMPVRNYASLNALELVDESK